MQLVGAAEGGQRGWTAWRRRRCAAIRTGVDLESLLATSAWMAQQLGKPSPSRVVKALAGAGASAFAMEFVPRITARLMAEDLDLNPEWDAPSAMARDHYEPVIAEAL